MPGVHQPAKGYVKIESSVPRPIGALWSGAYASAVRGLLRIPASSPWSTADARADARSQMTLRALRSLISASL
jgi:hypothetical protein